MVVHSVSQVTSLPAESLSEHLPTGLRWRWLNYRDYSSFSWPWFWRRTALIEPFVLIIASIQALIIQNLPRGLPPGSVTSSVGQHFLWAEQGFLILVCLLLPVMGPGLATLVRHRRWPLTVEQVCVSGAVVLGIALSFLLNFAASAALRPFLPELLRKVTASGGLRLVITVYQLIVFSALSGAVGLWTYFGERRQRAALLRERDLQRLRTQRDDAERRLAVIQAQVEPHFLFNTLASIRATIRQDPEHCEATLDALVHFLRATIPRLREGDERSASILVDQINVCRSYLDVVKFRVGDRFAYSFDVPADLLSARFPPLMLISLIENAVKHAVEKKPGAVHIGVTARLTGEPRSERLRVEVTDDGPGLPEGMGYGVGISNLRAQLKALYGEAGTFLIGDRAEGGVTARLEIPTR
jgi:hypothetical protein